MGAAARRLPRNRWLILSGLSDAIAALLHLAIIAGGADWYRVFGAGERLARLAEQRSIEPPLFALAIALVLATWSAFAFSGGGLIRRLPLLRPALVAIAAIYLARAAALPVMLRMTPGWSPAFLLWSSGIALVMGVMHAIGLWRGRRAL